MKYLYYQKRDKKRLKKYSLLTSTFKNVFKNVHIKMPLFHTDYYQSVFL